MLWLLNPLRVGSIEILGLGRWVALSLLEVAWLVIVWLLVEVGPTLHLYVLHACYILGLGLGGSGALIVWIEDGERMLIPNGHHTLAAGEHDGLASGILRRIDTLVLVYVWVFEDVPYQGLPLIQLLLEVIALGCSIVAW